MLTKSKCFLSLVSGVVGIGLASAQAAGFYLEERSVKASGRAFAGAAAMPDDVTVMSYNPAAITHLKRAQAAAGMYMVMPKASLTDAGSAATVGPFSGIPTGGLSTENGFSPQPSGYLYVAAPVTDDLWFGLSLTAPFGLKNDYEDNYFGRYDSTKSEVMVIEIAPTIAYRITPAISIGASLAIQRSSVTLVSAIPNPFDPAVPNAASDGEFDVDGKDWKLGFDVGVLFEPVEGFRIGVNYRAAVDHRLKGDAVQDFLGGVATQGVAATMELPDVISVAVAYDVTPDLTLLAQVNRYGWDRFQEIRLELEDGSELVSAENFKNVWGFSVGAQMRMSERLTLRSGIEYDKTPTVDAVRSTRIPDADRLWLAFGASYQLSDRFTVDFSYAHMFRKTEQINRVTPFPLLATSVDTVALTKTSSNVLGIGLTSNF